MRQNTISRGYFDPIIRAVQNQCGLSFRADRSACAISSKKNLIEKRAFPLLWEGSFSTISTICYIQIRFSCETVCFRNSDISYPTSCKILPFRSCRGGTPFLYGQKWGKEPQGGTLSMGSPFEPPPHTTKGARPFGFPAGIGDYIMCLQAQIKNVQVFISPLSIGFQGLCPWSLRRGLLRGTLSMGSP